jgi:hypothetical protein
VLPLHLRPGAREWFMAWLATDRPDLVPAYQRLYARGAYLPSGYRDQLADRVRPLLARHGLDRTHERHSQQASDRGDQHDGDSQLRLL